LQQSLGLSHNASPDSNNGCKEDHGNQDTKAKGKTNLAGPHQSKIIKKKQNRKKKGNKQKQTSSRMAPVAIPSDRSEFLPYSPLSKSFVFSK